MSVLRGVSPNDAHNRSRRNLAPAGRAALAVLAFAPALSAEPTAGAPPAAAAASAPAATPAPASRVDVQAQFRTAFDAKDYEAATALARRFVELTEKEVGAGSEELQVALMNLATTQYLSGDYVGAESSYLRAIELTEASPRPRIERLARANAGLAATYYAGKRYDLAVARFEKAVAFNRRSNGLMNDGQLPLLDKLAGALTELGRYQEALQVQNYTLRIAERKYGASDPRVAPTLEKIGRWYSRVGAYEQAQQVLRRAIAIVEDAEGENSPDLVGPLTAVADCSRRQLLDPVQMARATPDVGTNTFYPNPDQPAPFSPTAAIGVGQKALDRAVAIATGRPDPSPIQLADVLTQYGDWFQVRGQPDRALPQYVAAWQAAIKVPYKGKTLADALYGAPLLLNYTRPAGWDRYASRPAQEITLKTVLLASTVTPEGRTREARVVDDGGDARRADLALKALGTASYRPRIEDGKPAETADVQFTQVFQVLLPKEEAPKEPAPKPAEGTQTPPAATGEKPKDTGS